MWFFVFRFLTFLKDENAKSKEFFMTKCQDNSEVPLQLDHIWYSAFENLNGGMVSMVF